MGDGSDAGVGAQPSEFGIEWYVGFFFRHII